MICLIDCGLESAVSVWSTGWLWSFTGFVEVGTVGIWGYKPVTFPNDLELTVLADFANIHGFESVLVGGVHFLWSAGSIKLHAINSFTYCIYVERTCFFSSFGPNMDAEVGRFDRVTGHAFDTSGQLVAFAVVLEVAYEVAIRTAFYALEVVSASQVSYERWHVHCTKFIFRYGESHDGAVVRSEALVGEFLIERNIGVTIDGGENTSVTGSGKLFDLGNDGLVVLVVERSVFLDDVFVGYTFALQESLENFIGRTWENIVRTQKVELFSFQFVHHVLGSWNQLLIGEAAV